MRQLNFVNIDQIPFSVNTSKDVDAQLDAALPATTPELKNALDNAFYELPEELRTLLMTRIGN
jgi:hypothetical protein